MYAKLNLGRLLWDGFAVPLRGCARYVELDFVLGSIKSQASRCLFDRPHPQKYVDMAVVPDFVCRHLDLINRSTERQTACHRIEVAQSRRGPPWRWTRLIAFLVACYMPQHLRCCQPLASQPLICRLIFNSQGESLANTVAQQFARDHREQAHGLRVRRRSGVALNVC